MCCPFIGDFHPPRNQLMPSAALLSKVPFRLVYRSSKHMSRSMQGFSQKSGTFVAGILESLAPNDHACIG